MCVDVPGRRERWGRGGAVGSFLLVLLVLVCGGWLGYWVGLHAVVGPLRVQGMLVGAWRGAVAASRCWMAGRTW